MTAAELRRAAWVRAMCVSGDARMIRENARVSLRELAATVGVDHKALSRWEHGDGFPTVENAVAYAAALEALENADQTPPLAPYPSSAAEATADGMARYFTVQAHRHTCLGELEAASDMDTVAFLLRALLRYAPGHADRLARVIWSRRGDMPLGGWALNDLLAYGIDPETVLWSALEAS